MGFDDEVDQLKRELQMPKLDAAGRKAATSTLAGKLKDKLQTKRLNISFEEIEGEPAIVIAHTKLDERLAFATVNDDGSVTFQSSLAEEEVSEEVDDAGYFPPYVEYYDADEFLEEAPDMLKQGIAEYELDQEDDS
jgi:hypothetical protein